MIVFNNVTLKYPYDEFELLKGVSFTLHDGVNTILADGQSGKSSICKLLIKDIAPTSGQIVVDDMDIFGITNSNLGILYLPRNPVLFQHRNVRYNLEYPLKLRKVSRPERQECVSKIAELFHLELDVKVSKLSSEQKRSLALARGLTVKRKIALFDDFFDGGEQDLQNICNVLSNFDTCVLLSSNACLAMGHTVVLDGGFVVFEGDAQEAQQVVGNLHWLS